MSLKDLKKQNEKLNLIHDIPRLYLSDYFSDLRAQVDHSFAFQLLNDTNEKKREKTKLLWLKTIDQINSFEAECLNKAVALKVKFVSQIKEIEYILAENTSSNEMFEYCDELIRNVTFKLQKLLFLDKTIIFLDKNNYTSSSIFHKMKNSKLLIICDEYLSDQGIEYLKNFEINETISGNLTGEIIKINELKKSIYIHLYNSYPIDEISLSIKKLQSLDLAYNQIVSISPTAFDELKNLRELNLFFNKINEIDCRTFKNLTKLRVLILSFNEISHIEPTTFHGLTGLEKLSLYINQITSIHRDTFSGLSKLRTLELSSNQIESLDPKTFNGLLNLRDLNIASNKLLWIDCKLFNNLSNLKKLNLSSNKLTSIQTNTFQGLSNLRSLNLALNQLKSIDISVFHGLSNLRELNVDASAFSLDNLALKTFSKTNPNCRIVL